MSLAAGITRMSSLLSDPIIFLRYSITFYHQLQFKCCFRELEKIVIAMDIDRDDKAIKITIEI